MGKLMIVLFCLKIIPPSKITYCHKRCKYVSPFNVVVGSKWRNP